ncbi:MAG: dTDP-4-dehydrorhamnose reductase [Candidatus Aminicenantes bacterium]|nr:dTDP-4-dehydrorhamnose reductase [Candidatus Aminicenantes bacterium]
MRIAIIGADGQLGTDLVSALKGQDVVPLFWPEFDVTRAEAAAEVLSRNRPDTVINTAAFHRVDECEDRADQAFAVNAIAVRDLSRTCRTIGAVLVHFSTDYVFDGEKRKPYLEDDRPGPLSVYAASKLAGEHFVRAYAERAFVIRTCGLFGKTGCLEKRRNFIGTMLYLASSRRDPIRVVNDQFVTPTSTVELAARVAELIKTDAYGLYHMTAEGSCSWSEFARAIFELSGGDPSVVVPVDSASFGAKAKRPAYSVLENARMKTIGLTPFSYWRDALSAFLRDSTLDK